MRSEDERLEAPPGMESFKHLSMFNQERFDSIKKDEIEVPVIGEIELTEGERAILRKSPKFALPEKLMENTLKEDMEKLYSLLRMELRDEEDEEEPGADNVGGIDENKRDIEREEDAKSRQIFDPIEKIYDDRKRRVTDLVECSRVTLPKPLSVKREAQIEMRREVHNRIYQDYRREACNRDDEQEDNLNDDEKSGLKSLLKKTEKRRSASNEDG